MKRKISVIILILIVFLGLCMIPFFGACATEGEIIYALSTAGDHYYVYASKTNISDEQFNGMYPYYSESLGPVTEETEDSLPVTTIGANGFMGCTNLTNIVIPDFITDINSSAFAYCLSLKSVTFPHNENFKVIPFGIFGGDNSLFEIEIPETVERIEDYAFFMSHLYKVTVPSSVTYMGEGVFYRCEYLTSVEIYANIDAIPYATFCSCLNLRDVTFTSSVKEIKGYDILNGDGEIISEDDIIDSKLSDTDEDKLSPNYTDNITYTIPAFYYDWLDAGSDTITFDYEVEDLYFWGTEEELNQIVVGEYNVCLTESTVLTVYCRENDSWVEVNWRF